MTHPQTQVVRSPQPKQRCSWYAVERHCPRCNEYWPADAEFFYTSKGRLRSWCKACVSDDRNAKRTTLQ